MRLGAQQLNHFETFGFLVFRQLLSPEEMERFSEEFDSGMAAWLEDEEFDYPDRLDGATGALRVIPGSHRQPLHGMVVSDPGEAYGIPPEQMPAHVFESQPGDVLAFDVGLWHASFGGAAGRRQGVIVYYEDPESPQATEAVVSQMRGNHQIFTRKKRRMYGDHWRSHPGQRHQRWLRRLDELGVLDTPTETD